MVPTCRLGEVVWGVALLATAVVGAVVARRDWPLWNVLRRIRPATPERLVQASRGGRLDGRVVAVSGTAGPGPGGPLASAVNAEPCVWHRHVVHRRHIRYRTTERGTVQRRSLRRRVAEVASTEPFTLRGPSVRIDVAPAGMRVHRPVARGLRILPGLVSQPFPEPEAMLGRPGQLYWHREWVLQVGVRLFVLGEVRSYGARLTLHRPTRGPHIVSTRTAAFLRARTAASVFGGLALAAVAGPLGVVVLIIHFV